jgi:hypothetical protein
MSLINKINYRKLEDLSNEGFKVAITGLVVGTGADAVIATPTVSYKDPNTDQGTLTPFPSDQRYLIVTAFRLSTDSAAPVEAKLGFSNSVDPTVYFFEGYIGGTAGSVDRVYVLGDWKFGDQEYELVINAPAVNVSYTIDTRVAYSPKPLGYIQHEGNPEHTDGFGKLAPESSLRRGSPEY